MINDRIYTISQYVESKESLLDKINAIQALIDAMILKGLDVVGSAEYEEYQMDDGQMKVRTRYRSIEDFNNGIKFLEQTKQRYVNRYNGRVGVMRGGQISNC